MWFAIFCFVIVVVGIISLAIWLSASNSPSKEPLIISASSTEISIISPLTNLDVIIESPIIYPDPSAMLHIVTHDDIHNITRNDVHGVIHDVIPQNISPATRLNILWESAKKYEYQKNPWKVIYHHNIPDVAAQFSIIVPVFNQAAIIQRTLTSIIQCTTSNYELIIISDGSTDYTDSIILEWTQQIALSLDTCTNIIVIQTYDSLFETACDNLGFQMASTDNLIEIQADITITEIGYNQRMANVLRAYDDLIAISGRCTHNNTYAIGEASPDKCRLVRPDSNKCYLMATVNRGPLLFDRVKLQGLGWLDETRYAQGNDDHDLAYRAWVKYGYRVGYVSIGFLSNVEDGTTRKPMAANQRTIVTLRRRNEPPTPYATFEFPVYRFIEPVNLSTSRFVHITFANRETIHYANAQLAIVAHDKSRIGFDSEWLYTENDVAECISSLPKDTMSTRGYHYWAWKPWIILKTLDKLPMGSMLVYSDAGFCFTNATLVGEYASEEYKLFQNDHINIPYMKCEALEWMTRVTGERTQDTFMVDASVIFVRHTENNRAWLNEWLNLTRVPFLLSDVSSHQCTNSSKFIDHRHDQALLTIVANQFHLQYSTSKHVPIELGCHHRSRTREDFERVWENVLRIR